MKKIRILSIDGGGVRGIIPGTILMELEKILQKMDNNSSSKLGDYFDMIAGTSTGGILSCLYLVPGENGKAKYSA
ncbi:patatin-like phospholipase family protein, partial [Ferruginibacter sp.]|uniref:patatin-like phospholipase family protein n=1 Tax=Ferruginibacter sp. TaxID=1940288 RepID=UPI0019886D98